VTDDPITVSDVDDGLDVALSDRINQFNTDATGFDDGRWLRAAQRGRDRAGSDDMWILLSG
jgi:hypothetical protein